MEPSTALSTREKVFIVIIIVLIVAGGVAWYLHAHRGSASMTTVTPASPISISTPTKGQQLCTDGTLTITWQVPSDMDAVDIYLQKGNTDYPIEMGALANPVNGKGGSPYTYNLSGRYDPADNYKVDLGGDTRTGRANASSEYFSIVDCDDSGNPVSPPPPTATECKTASDCPTGYSCQVEGPLQAGQPVSMVCVAPGHAAPL